MPLVVVSSIRGQYPLTVNFSVDASDMATIISYEWNFGDGRVSYEKSPEHTYYMAGKYNGSFKIINEYGESWETTFTIYVYDWDITENEGTHVSFTNKCYRFAVRTSQGIGITQWGIGGDLPFPEAQVGTIKGYDKANNTISLILDNKTGRFYRIGVRELWKDKVGAYNDGVDINTMIRLKELTGTSGEEGLTEHIESRISLRPYSESYKGETGYTDSGFDNNFKVNLKLYANGYVDDPVAKLMNVYQYGDYVFGKRVENKRLQLQIETTTSAYKVTRVRQNLQSIDKATPDEIGGVRIENQFQKLFRGMDLWLSRDSKAPLTNRANGEVLIGDYEDLIDGPDGKGNSGFALVSSNSISVDLQQKSIVSTFMFWLGDMVLPGDVVTFKTNSVDDYVVQIYENAGYYIRLTNGGSWVSDSKLSWSGSGWVNISISSDGINMYTYENGVLKGIVAVPSFLSYYGGETVIGGLVASMYDIRRIPRNVSPDALQWYCDDVVNNNGAGGLLPVMR